MPLYKVFCAEEVLDAEDTFEHFNHFDPVEVEAASIDEAVRIVHADISKRNYEERSNGGFLSSGSFTVLSYKAEGNGELWENPLPQYNY